ACKVYAKYIENNNYDYFDEHVGDDDLLSVKQMTEHANRAIPTLLKVVENEVQQEQKKVSFKSAWRVEGTLREYPKFDPVNMWFKYPVHVLDDTGVLKDVEPEGETPPWQKDKKGKKKTAKERREEQNIALETAYEACSIDEVVTLENLAEYMGVTDRTVRNRLQKHKGFEIENGEVIRIKDKK